MRRNEIQKIYNRLRHNQEADWVIQTDEKTVIRRFIPHQRLILLGGGHIAGALCHFAVRLDFDVMHRDSRMHRRSFVMDLFPQSGNWKSRNMIMWRY